MFVALSIVVSLFCGFTASIYDATINKTLKTSKQIKVYTMYRLSLSMITVFGLKANNYDGWILLFVAGLVSVFGMKIFIVLIKTLLLSLVDNVDIIDELSKGGTKNDRSKIKSEE